MFNSGYYNCIYKLRRDGKPNQNKFYWWKTKNEVDTIVYSEKLHKNHKDGLKNMFKNKENIFKNLY